MFRSDQLHFGNTTHSDDDDDCLELMRQLFEASEKAQCSLEPEAV